MAYGVCESYTCMCLLLNGQKSIDMNISTWILHAFLMICYK